MAIERVKIDDAINGNLLHRVKFQPRVCVSLKRRTKSKKRKAFDWRTLKELRKFHRENDSFFQRFFRLFQTDDIGETDIRIRDDGAYKNIDEERTDPCPSSTYLRIFASFVFDLDHHYHHHHHLYCLCCHDHWRNRPQLSFSVDHFSEYFWSLLHVSRNFQFSVEWSISSVDSSLHLQSRRKIDRTQTCLTWNLHFIAWINQSAAVM